MLRVQNVTRSFNDQSVLRGVNLDVEQGEIICLLGPSGCGKTTLLRIVAGLERADTGDVLLDEQTILNVAVHKRDFGLMFQDFALFPHMNAGQNVAFGLRMHHADKIQDRVHEMLELVGLAGFEKRDVSQLSGGERQRVALARSLAPNPRLLMLDEPLGSLDASLRARLVVELRQIIKDVGLTAIYVTHDQQEAFAVADRIAVMNYGSFEQVNTPELVYRQPATEFVARFFGLTNILPVHDYDDHFAHTAVGQFVVAGHSAKILLHPIGIEITEKSGVNTMNGVVHEVIFAGDTYHLEILHASGIRLSFEVSARIDSVPAVGTRVNVAVMPDMIIALDR